MIDLSIIIVSYNTKEFLEKCVASILEHKQSLQIEVIIVDNASVDNSVQMIKKEYKDVILIENKKNLGFSKANNLGVKKAKGKYILFLNPDTVVQPVTLSAMYEFMEKQTNAGVATCRVDLLNGELDDACHRGFPTPWNAFCHFFGFSRIFPRSRIFAGYSMGWEDLSKTHEIDACAGAFMIVRKLAGEEIDWWDEDYFWYGEDIDFCYKLKQKNWKIYFVPTTSVLHYKGVSGGIKSTSKNITTASKETKMRATRARFEAMRIFYNKHYQKKYPKVITRLALLGISLKEKLSFI